MDLMFRDESSHVIKKAKARARKRANLPASPPTPPPDSGSLSTTPETRMRQLSLVVPSTPPYRNSIDDRDGDRNDEGSSMLMSPESGSWPATPPMAQLYDIPATCQEDGIAYFFSRYVTAEETVSYQRFDFIREVWKPSQDAHKDGVLAGMIAVGLMGLANTTQSPSLKRAATKSYCTALRLTNIALENRADYVKDSTMLSILILGVFEIMEKGNQSVLDSFHKHVKGAMAVAKERGPDQFRTEAGRRMFAMLCERVTVSCTQRNEPMPEFLIDLSSEMLRISPNENDDLRGRLVELRWKVPQLRYEIKNGLLSDPATIVDRLVSIDEEFESRIAALPSDWKYQTLKIKQDHPAVFGRICHRYTSVKYANAWNRIRNTRILILESILAEIWRDLTSFCPTLDPARYTEIYHKARRRLKQIVNDVAASIPQQLGLLNMADGSIGRGGGNSDNDDESATPIATIEIVSTPSPPVSPSVQSSDSASTRSLTTSLSTSDQRRRPGTGVTVVDVVKGKDAEDEAERYMCLISATHAIVLPLFTAGMSTMASRDLVAYAVGRLRALYMESGIRQADMVANMLEEYDMAAGLEMPLTGAEGGGAGVQTGGGGGGGAPWVDAAWLGGPGDEMTTGPRVGQPDDAMGLFPMTSPEMTKPPAFDAVWT